ncbi:hypothetical protein LC55x_4498 [Lysobacter capsici]|nr:hypothetical protein LC55x_4498 [Lysobacter capsici]
MTAAREVKDFERERIPRAAGELRSATCNAPAPLGRGASADRFRPNPASRRCQLNKACAIVNAERRP